MTAVYYSTLTTYLCQINMYFFQVFVSFLMKGHTHEDIDQRFSKVSHILKRRDARTLVELTNILLGSLLRTTPEVTVWSKLYDIKGWMFKCVDDLFNHSNPHLFRYAFAVSELSLTFYLKPNIKSSAAQVLQSTIK